MLIYNPNDPYNFDEKLRPLFNAMCEGQTIKSIVCNSYGVNSKGFPDFTITNFKAFSYCVNKPNPNMAGKTDYVKGEKGGFWMNQVVSFELSDYRF